MKSNRLRTGISVTDQFCGAGGSSLGAHKAGLDMAFPSQYVVLGTKREVVKQFGNAVTPPAMEFLIQRCVESLAA